MGSRSRRAFLISAFAAGRVAAQGRKAAPLPSEMVRYSDPATEFPVYRLTDPAHSSFLPGYYQRFLARRGSFMIFASDRTGNAQVFRMDLKSGESRQLTQAEALDPASPTLQPDERSFCYFDGPSLRLLNMVTLREREIYRVPSGWERCAGSTVSEDGGHAVFGERQQGGSRLRLVSLVRGAAQTVTEVEFPLADAISRPRRAQVLFRNPDQELWLVNSDGQQKRKLNLADGLVGPANWAPDGRTVLYLNLPADKTQLNNIRENTPDQNSDKLVAKTSQFAHFGFNRNTSVFVGASRNGASPNILLLLRITRREFTLCEHRSSQPAAVAPVFSGDSQRVYFQSDRHGKPAIYCVRVEKLVEETEETS
jgi:oligogalacturonide lyase